MESLEASQATQISSAASASSSEKQWAIMGNLGFDTPDHILKQRAVIILREVGLENSYTHLSGPKRPGSFVHFRLNADCSVEDLSNRLRAKERYFDPNAPEHPAPLHRYQRRPPGTDRSQCGQTSRRPRSSYDRTG